MNHRRRFLKAAIAAGAGVALEGFVPGAAGETPKARVRVTLIR